MENLGDILKRVTPTRSISGGEPPHQYNDIPEQPNSCEICCGRGWFTPDVPAGHAEFGQVITCRCQQERIAEQKSIRLLRYSNIGHLSRFTFDKLDPNGRTDDVGSQKLFTNAYQVAVEYAEKPTGWLVFTGPNGSGKTHLAAAIANRSIDRGHVVLFVHVPDLLDHLRGSFAPSSDVSYSDLFQQVRTTPLLILDSLESQSTTPWAREKLQQIINHRYDAELPTVITTASEIAEIDPYIRTRIRTEGLSRIVEVRIQDPGPVHRLGRIGAEMLRRMTFDTFDVLGNNSTSAQRIGLKAAYKAASNFAADPDGWLTLYGDTGVGKTHLAIAIAAERVKKGQDVFFAFVPELLDYLRHTYTPDSSIAYDALLEEIKNAAVLILDDLGKERSSPWAVEKLYQIIVHRHNSRLPTIVTTMVDFTKEREPIGSRVQDPSVGQLIEINAPDYRNKRRRVERRPIRR